MKEKLRQFLIELSIIDSVIGILGVAFILGAALGIQFFFHEEPCPLCLLQRAGFVSLGLSLMMNFRYGNRVAHWALGILSSTVGMAVSIRQILLHITDPIGMGGIVLGLHMYSWACIAFALGLVGCTLMLIIYPEKNNHNGSSSV